MIMNLNNMLYKLLHNLLKYDYVRACIHSEPAIYRVHLDKDNKPYVNMYDNRIYLNSDYSLDLKVASIGWFTPLTWDFVK